MSKRSENDERPAPVKIQQIATGVPGLDEILGGGLPEYSFNIIAGAPGSGKTTLAHQIMFANASQDRPALYFTVLGEPAVKMLRYQQQFSFFDPSKVDGAIRFVNLSQVVLDNDLGAVLDAIVKEVENTNASIVVVDSFRTVVRRAQAMGAKATPAEIELQGFVQRLALHLTSWQATSFLVGEYVEGELRDNPVFTVADGLFWLYQSLERNSIVRKMQVMKIRGQASVPGMHTFRITGDGIQTFPRTYGLSPITSHVKGQRRLSTGIAKLDALLGGGIPEGESMLVAGPSGSGKSTLGMQFIDEGLKHGEPGIVAIFEELPAEHVQRAAMFGIDFDKPQKDGKLKLIYLRPLDLSVDETVHEIVDAVNEIGCKRLVIDSLVGFEMALAPGFREDFRESLYRMIAALTRLGVTIVSTVEIEEDFTSMVLSKFTVSFLADDILRMRYVSINGQFRKMLMVVKMRRSRHSIDMHEFQITSEGVVIGEPLRGYRGLTSGIPEPWSAESGQNDPNLQSNADAGTKKEPRPRPRKGRKRGKRFKMKTASSSLNMEQQLREMNEALLISSLHQHELTEQAQQAETALRASEERFRTLFDLGPVAVYSCDASGMIMEFNRRAAELWGRAPALGDTDERFCGSFRMILPDGSVLAHEKCQMAEVLSGTVPYARDAELSIERPDGSRVTVVVNIHPLKNEQGEITGAINCFYDITERKQAEEASARLAAIVTSSDDAIISKDLDGIITSWNRGAQRLFGYTAEEAIGKSVSLLIPENHRDEEPRILSSIRNGESIEHYETVRRRKDGRLLDISLTVSPIKNSVGQIIGASKVARDITERKQNEVALRESEDRYRNLFNSMDEGYCIIEMIFGAHDKPVDYRFLEVNRAFEKQSGMHDVIGKRMLEFVPSIEEHWLANYGSVALTGEPVRFANEYKTLNRWFDVYAFRIGAPGSRRVAVLFSDITARKQAEEQLQLAKQEADEANRAKDMFLATLSHEVRTPLSAIVGWMQILQGGPEGGCTHAELSEGLEVIERNARTMVQLLDDVMDVSRIISGKVRMEVRPCELRQVIHASIDVVRSAARARDIALSAELDPAASAASCDAARMQQVVWNLLSNAIKFKPKGGKVRVTLARDGTDVRIQVSDSGQGIDPELLPYVFDRFRQADSSTRRRFGGLGLGLSIVKHLVELHGGTVQAQSEGEGRGSTFTVLLPIRAVRTDDTGNDPDADESELPSTAGRRVVRLDALRVLVVDDDPDARRLLVKVLREAGAVVTAAANATEAIAAIAVSSPEVLVSDLGMPDQDGFDLIRQVRSHGYHAKDLPAVALSAFVHQNDRRQALLAGFQMHVPKPADPHDLTAAIATLAGRTGPGV